MIRINKTMVTVNIGSIYQRTELDAKSCCECQVIKPFPSKYLLFDLQNKSFYDLFEEVYGVGFQGYLKFSWS